MTETDLYGPLIAGPDVEAAVIAHIRARMPEHLAGRERALGLQARALPPFASFNARNTTGWWPDDILPSLVVVSPGLFERPSKEGSGRWTARWSVRLTAIVSANSREATRDLAGHYAAALRQCVAQNPSLGGFASGVRWLDEAYDEIPDDRSRTLAAGQAAFWVEVRDVLDSRGGPPAPPGDPYADPGQWPQVTATDLQADIEESP